MDADKSDKRNPTNWDQLEQIKIAGGIRRYALTMC